MRQILRINYNESLLRPLPIPHPKQIVALTKGSGGSRLSYLDLLDLRNQAGVLSDVFGYDTGSAGLSADGKPWAVCVQHGYWELLFRTGSEAAAGPPVSARRRRPAKRGFDLVLGYSFWQKRFAGDPAVIGKQITVNGRSATIIGHRAA